jgi:alpha-galactosidase
MPKIVLIGAGSGFGSRLSVDILSYPELQDSDLCLVDIVPERAEGVAKFVRRVVEHHNLPTRVHATADRREVLEGADYVIVSIAVGGPAYNGVPYYYEVVIPAKYGIKQQVADTVGVGGVFRALRCAPVMMDICRDMQELCPKALMINYTNPMAMLCWAMYETAPIDVIGLCHSVQGTHNQLAGYMGIPADEIFHWVAGINHMSWFLRLERKGSSHARGEDLYPLLREVAKNPEIVAKDRVRFEIFKHFGYFVTESSRHMSEYVPWFRKRDDIMKEFDLDVRQPTKDGTSAKRFWEEDIPDGGNVDIDALALRRSKEYASGIIHAIETDTLFRFNGNVRNGGIITNLPPRACVEVPCLVDASGIRPCYVGELPTQLAAMNMSNIVVQQLTVEALLERDLNKAFMACCLDPHAAAVCSLAEIRSMFDEMVDALTPWLGYMLNP